MAWKKILTGESDEKKEEVVDPEKKLDEKKKEPEKSPAELIAEALKPFTERFDAVQAEIESLKVKTTPKDKQEVTSVMDDENEAFNQRLTPIMAKTLELEAKGNLRDVEFEYRKAGYGDLWDENRKEIEAEIAKTSLVTTSVDPKTGESQVVPLRGNPQYIQNVVDMTFGRAMKKAGVKYGKEGDDKKGTFFLEDATGDETVVTRREKVTDGITKSQIHAAGRLGIDIKDYKKAAAKLKFVDRGERVEKSA